MESFLTALGPTKSLETMEVLFSLSVSFVLGLILATVYRWTHQGFSYGRSFTYNGLSNHCDHCNDHGDRK